MNTLLLAVAVVLLVSVALVALGLAVRPAPFPPHGLQGVTPDSVPLPGGLPPPVDRFYRTLYGAEIPVVRSAIVSGRATLRPFAGIPLPSRFRFTHDAGSQYRHAIETTLYGVPFLRIHETYLDGRARMELPFGTLENDPRLDQGANLALWAEAIWFPSVLVTDPRAEWEDVDEHTAILRVPYGDTHERFVVRFDPDTGMVRFFESMRYPGIESARKELWINEALRWDTVDGHLVPVEATVTWLHQGQPWAYFTVESLTLNADVEASLRQAGP